MLNKHVNLSKMWDVENTDNMRQTRNIPILQELLIQKYVSELGQVAYLKCIFLMTS